MSFGEGDICNFYSWASLRKLVFLIIKAQQRIPWNTNLWVNIEADAYICVFSVFGKSNKYFNNYSIIFISIAMVNVPKNVSAFSFCFIWNILK